MYFQSNNKCLSKSQAKLLGRRCASCDISLPIAFRKIYCLRCGPPIKYEKEKERRTKVKLGTLVQTLQDTKE